MKGLNDAYVESVIKKAISGKLETGQAAAKLGISKQYVNRLKKAYAEKGASAFDHGNKGKARPWKTDAETEERIAVLYKAKYEGFNFRHFLEKLNEEEGDLHHLQAPPPNPHCRRIQIAEEAQIEEGEGQASFKAKEGNASGSCSKSMPPSITGSATRCRRPPSTGP
jgi:transposase